jgi:hypothetical protein
MGYLWLHTMSFATEMSLIIWELHAVLRCQNRPDPITISPYQNVVITLLSPSFSEGGPELTGNVIHRDLLQVHARKLVHFFISFYVCLVAEAKVFAHGLLRAGIFSQYSPGCRSGG